MIYIFIITSLFLLDYIIKSNIVKKYNGQKTARSICNHHIILRFSKNYGAILNSGSGHPLLVKALSLLSMLLMLLSLICSGMKKSGVCITSGITLIISGGLSNTFDRFRRGYVVDYFSINTKKIPRLSDIVFNLGDMFIFSGIILLFIGSLRDR